MPHKRDVFNVCGAWAFYQLSKTGSYMEFPVNIFAANQ